MRAPNFQRVTSHDIDVFVMAQYASYISLIKEATVRFISLIILSCLSLLTHAVVVSDLYQAQVEVADQSQKNRTVALNTALQQVLVKVSGSKAPLQDTHIKQKSHQPDSFVRSYSYSHNPITNQLELDVHFAQNLIDDLLRQRQQPIWGRSRPLVLMWQAVEEDKQRFFVGSEKALWHYEFEKAMSERGIPTIWPTLDLEDRMALPMANLWGLFRDDISSASERYLTDGYLAGRLIKTADDIWQYRGFFHSSQAPLVLEAQDQSQQVVLADIADQVANFLAQRYAVQSNSESNEQQLDITNVNSFQQYQNVLSYLQANSVIKEVRVVAVKDNLISLELSLSSSWEQAWSTLALDHRLMATDQPQTYQWQQ